MKNLIRHAVLLLFAIGTVFSAFAQFTVTGTVTSSGGNALPGATVKVRNSNTGSVSTDASGKFSITVPGKKNDVEISFVGYKSQSFSVDEATNSLAVQLTDDVGNWMKWWSPVWALR